MDIEQALQAALFRLMTALPTERASALGAFVVRHNVKFNRPEIIAGARRNLARYFPGASAADIGAMVSEFLDGVGRMMGEFAVMDRFIAEQRLEPVGLDQFKVIAGKEPVLTLGLHTGNWETFGPMFQAAGIPLFSFYDPPDNAFERKVAEATRARFGVGLLSPDASGVRQAMRHLKRNEVVMIFPDEAREGRVMGPLFGRTPHLHGNLAIAARLARHAGAKIVICHSERTGPCRFRLTFGDAFALPARDGEADHLADVAVINDHVEPIVRRNIPRWYFLDDSIGSLADLDHASVPQQGHA